MKLNKNFFDKVYNVVFWYLTDKTLPNSLCNLFWSLVFGTIVLLPISILVCIEYIMCWIGGLFSKINLPVNNLSFGEKALDKLEKTSEVLKETFGEFTNLLIIFVFTVLFFILASFSGQLHKSFDNNFTFFLFVVLLICFLISLMTLIVLILFILTAYIGAAIILFSKTKVGSKILSPISRFLEKSFDKLSDFSSFIMDKYCPKITWYDESNK